MEDGAAVEWSLMSAYIDGVTGVEGGECLAVCCEKGTELA